MTSAPEKIKSVLGEQIKEYKNLLALLRMERKHLIDFDQEGVEDLAKQKDTAVLKLRLLEQERLRLMEEFSRVSGRRDGMSLQDVSSMTGDGSFLDIRRQLISLLQGIQELNEFNRILIDRSLQYIGDSIDFLGKAGARTGRGDGRTKGLVVSRQI